MIDAEAVEHATLPVKPTTGHCENHAADRTAPIDGWVCQLHYYIDIADIPPIKELSG